MVGHQPFSSSSFDRKLYPNVRPADKSLKKIKARLTELTGRELTAIPLGAWLEM